MTIIGKEVVNASRSPFAPWNLTRYQIDPKSVHETPLLGNHTQYSYVSAKNFGKIIEAIQDFKVRPSDVWIVGNMKTGTTWTHNICYKLIHGVRDINDIANKLQEQYFERLHKIEFEAEFLEPDRFDNIPSPRIFKTHLPAFLLPKQIWTVKPKIIYTIRNPKDTIISEYHMIRNSIFGYNGSLEDYADLYMNFTTRFSPYFDHLLGFLQLKHLDHILFSVYEERLDHPFEEIKRINDFLQCGLNDDQLKELVEEVSFTKMQNEFPSFLLPTDKSVPDPNYKFCREGKAGGYRNVMSNELIKKIDVWSAEKLKGVDFQLTD